MPAQLLARKDSAFFAFAIPNDPTHVAVFDAGAGDVYPSVPLPFIDGWSTDVNPGAEVVDTNTDSALRAAQARIEVLFNGPNNQNAADKVDETGLTDGLTKFPGTEDELTLAADADVTLQAEDTGEEDDTGGAEFAAGDVDEPEEFTVTLLEEGVPTIDGRIFAADSVTWRDPPMPLMFTTENSGEGHKGSKLGGVITRVYRDGAKIKGAGRFDMSENGQELKRLISDGVLNGFSADVGGALSEMSADENGVSQQSITQGRIMGGTVLPFQAFDDTRISVVTATLGAVLNDTEVNVPEQDIQEPIKEDDDALQDAQQAEQLNDIAKRLGGLVGEVEKQAQEEMEDSQDEDFSARVATLEFAITSLANRILADKVAS